MPSEIAKRRKAATGYSVSVTIYIMNNLKNSHEKASVVRFLGLFNEINKESISFVRLGDPRRKEPDCICSGNVAIELVGAYDNQYQASKMWSEARGRKQNKPVELRLLTFENLETAIAGKLEKLNKGKYSGFKGRLLLLCNLHSPLLTDTDVINFQERYIPFKQDNHYKHYFDEIWITWKSEKNGVWQIKVLE